MLEKNGISCTMKQIETETGRNGIKKMDRMNKKEYRRFPVLDQSTF